MFVASLVMDLIKVGLLYDGFITILLDDIIKSGFTFYMFADIDCANGKTEHFKQAPGM